MCLHESNKGNRISFFSYHFFFREILFTSYSFYFNNKKEISPQMLQLCMFVFVFCRESSLMRSFVPFFVVVVVVASFIVLSLALFFLFLTKENATANKDAQRQSRTMQINKLIDGMVMYVDNNSKKKNKFFLGYFNRSIQY